jgi:FtsH-binding integral membrane protein
MTLFISGLVFSFFAVGDLTRFAFAVAGAGVFSCYIVYDTNELILRHSLDEYVWASVGCDLPPFPSPLMYWV